MQGFLDILAIFVLPTRPSRNTPEAHRNVCIRIERTAAREQGGRKTVTTIEDYTSATGSMVSADPGGVVVGSEPSAEPNLAAAEADTQVVAEHSREQRAHS